MIYEHQIWEGSGLGMTPALSPAQIKKKEAWAGDEKLALR